MSADDVKAAMRAAEDEGDAAAAAAVEQEAAAEMDEFTKVGPASGMLFFGSCRTSFCWWASAMAPRLDRLHV